MKKKLLFTIAMALLTITFTNAQEIRFAAKAGFNQGILNMGVEDKQFPDFDFDEYGTRPGFYVGARLEYGLSQRMSIQSELIYQVIGGEFDFKQELNEDGYFYESTNYYNITLTEFSMPIVYKFYIVPQKFSLNAGLSLGFIVNAVADIKVAEYENGEVDGDIIDVSGESIGGDLKKINVGLGGGFEYIVTDYLFLDLRYNIGLNNLEDGVSEGSTEFWFYGSVFQIGGGWRF